MNTVNKGVSVAELFIQNQTKQISTLFLLTFRQLQKFYPQDPQTGYCPQLKNVIFSNKWLNAEN
jgi:hypothetical protein